MPTIKPTMKRRSFIKALTGIAAIPLLLNDEPVKAIGKPYEKGKGGMVFGLNSGRIIISDKWAIIDGWEPYREINELQTCLLGSKMDPIDIYKAWESNQLIRLQNNSTEAEGYITSMNLSEFGIDRRVVLTFHTMRCITI